MRSDRLTLAMRRCGAPSSWWKRCLRRAGVLVCLQVSLWLTIGIRSLPRYLPEMIARDMAQYRQYYEDRGKPVPVPESPRYFVLCDRLVSRLSEPQLEEMQTQLAPTVILLREGFDRQALRGDGSSPQIDRLCYHVDLSTPLIAYIEYGKRDCPLCSWGVGHRAWFVLGRWFPTEMVSSWVS